MASLFRGRNQQKKDKGSTQVLPETQWANEPMPSGIPAEESVVITISRQFGSGGAEIGRIVAQRTGLQYVDHHIIDEVARRLGVEVGHAARQDEQTAGAVTHILEAIQSSNPFTVNYNTLFGPTPAPTQARESAYLHLTQKVVLDLATKGNAVIIGRGAQFLLHSSPRTLHIYIFAPLPDRIENVIRNSQVGRTQAIELIEQRDRDHDSYLRRYYGNTGHQPSLYHLLINTGLFSYELAADLIQQALPIAKEMN